MPTDVQRIQAVFLAAAEIADPANRAKFLNGACDGDTELRARVEALLRAHDQPDSLLDHPAAVAPDPDPGATQALNGTPDPDPVMTATRTVGGENGSSDDEALAFLAPPQRPDSLGRIGHYEVLQVLGRGGFGIVFRAFDEVLQRVVALKVMAPQLAATSPARKRFLREARSSAQVRHENVVHVYEVAEQPLPYLAMEFIPGETLQQRLDRVGPVEPAEVVRIGRQIAEGLAAAHATDLIHRDIKPGNVLLEGGQHKVKITDFGLARAADDASISQSGIIAGTPMYMAPEQAQGQPLDQRADLFSLGSVLYQMASGRPPFRANTTVAVLKRVAEDAPRPIREIIPETPQWLCDIIAKLHAKDPADRYQSAREVADVLADCEAQLKANAKLKDYSRIPRSKPQRSGRRKWVAVAVTLLLPLIALTATEFSGVTHLFHKQPGVVPWSNPAPGPDDAESKGWVQLFNGKDLTGWKTNPDQPGEWKVEAGSIVGRGPEVSHLFSDRSDFRDFHLRVAAKLNAAGEFGHIFFRSGFDLPLKFGNISLPRGFDAQFRSNGKEILAGQLAFLGPKPLLAEVTVPPDTWFTYEILAQGDRIVVRVNGQTTTDYREEPNEPRVGHIALAVWPPDTVVHFRKIEIKELPAAGIQTESGAKDKPSPTAITPFTDADAQRIAALPAEQQVEEVRKELMRRNPGFDGKMEHKIEHGVVTEFRIVTDRVTDIAPIRVFNALRVLDCRGTNDNGKPNGLLADLVPLTGMNPAALEHLNLDNTKVGDAGLAIFKDCKNLLELHLWNTKLSDAGLANFKDCTNLTLLALAETRVSDAGLANFKDCTNLTVLGLNGTRVSDAGLIHFKDCKNLTQLHLQGANVSDAGLANLSGTPLRTLWIDGTQITDLTPLQGMPLEEIRLTPKNITQGLDILRDMKSLKTIGVDWDKAWPAAKFWQRYDKGEFKE